MITVSEIVVTITIWVLTAAGLFFSLRAGLRRRNRRNSLAIGKRAAEATGHNDRGLHR